MTTPFLCSPDNATIPAWFKVRDGLWASVPLMDEPSGLYSRLTYREALAACSRLGVRMPTALEIDAIRDAAICAEMLLEPVCLPDAEMCRAAGIPLGSKAEDDWRSANMGGQPWCELADRKMATQIAALGWRPGMPIFNVGKHYCAGAPPGRAYLKGWWLRLAKKYIQHGPYSLGDQGPHSDVGSRDDGTTTIVVSDVEPAMMRQAEAA